MNKAIVSESKNSGHRELILILEILVLSSKKLISSLNLGLSKSLVVGCHQAHKLTHVNTTSFHQLSSKSTISFNISSLGLE
ncbi:MAG: hypothetical protein U9Q66_01375 [Patescibacteria group bacterium]|nr:hypothetical protein [Patescibacteria group bacterium]